MRRSAPILAALLFCAACGPKGGGAIKPNPDIPPLSEKEAELPKIPSRIETSASAPTEGDTPSSRSPVLDIMVGENARSMAVLGKAADPAYYLAYQIVEQRVVSLDAEGGALVGDSDDTDRILDVEIRVGAPELDNTRALSDDANELNQPLRRRAIVPFGDDPLSIANHIWLETDRRYREGVIALAYVRQDQRTLGKRAAVADFAPSKKQVYIGKPAKLTAADVSAEFGGDIDAIIDGGSVPAGDPTLVDATGDKPRVTKVGLIPAEAILGALAA